MREPVRRAMLALMLCGGIGFAGPASAAPGDMSVATFLAKADALLAKGFMALASSDVRLLKAEGTAAGEAYRAQLASEKAAGKPSSCPPASTRIGHTQVLNHLRTYAPAVRPAVTMRAAMADLFIRQYPCR